MKKILIILMIIFIFHGAFAHAKNEEFESCDASVIQEVETYLQGIRSFSARFTQLNKHNKISYGDFFLKKPNFIRLNYGDENHLDTPKLVMIYNKAMISRNSKKNVYLFDSAMNTVKTTHVPDFFLETMLSGKINNLKLRCVATSKTSTETSVTLQPTSGNQNTRFTFIFSRSPKLSLASIENHSSRENIKIDFSAISYRSLDDKEFEFDIANDDE